MTSAITQTETDQVKDLMHEVAQRLAAGEPVRDIARSLHDPEDPEDPDPEKRADRQDRASAAGAPWRYADAYASVGASVRHDWRTSMTLHAAADRLSDREVSGSGYEAADPSLAAAAVAIWLDMQTKRTARLDGFADLGSGRWHAQDGGAWRAAAEHALVRLSGGTSAAITSACLDEYDVATVAVRFSDFTAYVTVDDEGGLVVKTVNPGTDICDGTSECCIVEGGLTLRLADAAQKRLQWLAAWPDALTDRLAEASAICALLDDVDRVTSDHSETCH